MGYKEDWGDEIDDLKRRMAEVEIEALSNQLKQKVDTGVLVKSVTPLASGGWKIEFISGDPIEVSNIVGNTGGGVTEITIGPNGNWFIDGVDTDESSRGEDGTNGMNGKDGTPPHIGANNNWFIGNTDTSTNPKGADRTATLESPPKFSTSRITPQKARLPLP